MEKELTKKLNIKDYTLEIDGKYITNCVLEYSLNENEVIYYNEGTREKIDHNQVITFCIKGKAIDTDVEAWIRFELNTNIDELNNYPRKPINITSKLSKSEAFIKRPTKENSEFLNFYIPTNTKEDMYNNLSSIWVLKEEENKFIFKICIPTEFVFAYFKVDFTNK